MKLTIKQAAAIMDVTPRFLQMELQQGRFPFGVGVEMDSWFTTLTLHGSELEAATVMSHLWS